MHAATMEASNVFSVEAEELEETTAPVPFILPLLIGLLYIVISCYEAGLCS